MFKLVATFTTSLGKKQTWSLNNPDPNKTAGEVKSLLQRLTGIKLFHKDGTDLFNTVESAKYVETTETILFDNTQEQLQHQRLTKFEKIGRRTALLYYFSNFKGMIYGIRIELIFSLGKNYYFKTNKEDQIHE